MNELMQKKPPFAWIEYTHPEQVTQTIERVIAYRGWPLLSIDQMPEEALLHNWINKYSPLNFHVKANSLTAADLANLIQIAQRRVFFEGGRPYELEERLSQGSSIIMGSDDIGSDNIIRIHEHKPVGSKIWIDSRGFKPSSVNVLLEGGLKMLFSSISAHRFSESSLHQFVDRGKQNAMIHAYHYPPNMLKDFLKRGATLLFLGDTKYMAPRYIRELYEGATEEQKKRIRAVLKNGTEVQINDMEVQLETICIAEDKVEAFLFA